MKEDDQGDVEKPWQKAARKRQERNDENLGNITNRAIEIVVPRISEYSDCDYDGVKGELPMWVETDYPEKALKFKTTRNNLLHKSRRGHRELVRFVDSLKSYKESNSLEDATRPNIPVEILADIGFLVEIKMLVETQDKTDAFLKSLKISCEGDGEFCIREPKQRIKTIPPNKLHCLGKGTEEWKALIEMLKSPGGEFQRSGEAERQKYLRLEDRLKNMFSDMFQLNFPDGYKIFVKSPDKKGCYQPVFKANVSRPEKIDDFTGYTREQTYEAIEYFLKDSDPESENKLAEIFEHARKIGFTEDEIVSLYKKHRKNLNSLLLKYSSEDIVNDPDENKPWDD